MYKYVIMGIQGCGKGTQAKLLHDYHTKTKPILDLFSRKELIVSVDGANPAPAVYKELCDKLGVHKSALAR
jgi:adenylate kinase family enzyme